MGQNQHKLNGVGSVKTVLIVGADNLGSVPKTLNKKLGVEKVIHWDGRRTRVPGSLPKGVSLVIVYTEFICHNMMKRVRKLAKKSKVPVIYLRRGLAELEATG